MGKTTCFCNRNCILYSLTNVKITSRLKGIDPSKLKFDNLLEKITAHDENKSASNETKVSVTEMFGSKLCYDIITS